MKSTEQIEQSLRKLEVEPNDEKRERTRRDLMEAQARQRENKTPGWHRGSFRRAMMTVRTRKIAATVTLALLLLAALGVGTGSVALSQTHHAVNATLAWLKSMIVGGEVEAPPALTSGAGEASEQTPNPNRRPVTCATRVFRVSREEQGVWQSLRDQGIELVGVSTDPEVYYAVLSPERAESFDASVTLKCLAAPRVTVLEGESAAIAVTNDQPRGGLALAWLPIVTSDGKEVQSTISFHDGHRGFELPNVSTESRGVVLLRVRGMFPPVNQDSSDPGEALICLRVSIQ